MTDEAPEISRPAGIDEAHILRVFRVPPESAGRRVDVFIASQLRNTSRTRARAIVENSAFTPDGRRLCPSDRLRAEDRVVLWRPPFEVEDEEPIELRSIYEDDSLLVIDKPPLVAVHPTARYYRNTVIKRLSAKRPETFLSLIHRLDRETSGILLVAKTAEADRAFKRLLEDRSIAAAAERLDDAELTRDWQAAARRGAALADRVHKTYLAITWGEPPEGTIDAPLEVDPTNPLRVKMRIARRGQGMEARTEVSVLERRQGYSLVACRLLTGRQHQIRIHLAAQGTAVVGDKLYGPDERMHARGADDELTLEDLGRLELPRQALHAHRYQLPHALTGRTLDLIAPLAPDLARFWAQKEEA
ncbi:MAG: RluA family pseudouridine synthase [Polyangiaceae bacterium]|nr:RluA family pseudouridine synthase [Polyangiaceae bacterium]